ncbi:MAG TPA: hypothetical protein VN461_19280 [Vicinamibacteria bacterium]|jgi:hypothetical protein|nr:hypothetical protein [Vicinamibacteria bacterium]
MPQGRVSISMTFGVMAWLVVAPRLAHGQTPDELAQFRHLNHLRHLPAGLVAAELRAGEEADNDADDADRLRAIPAVFVGPSGSCGPGYPAGANIVTAAWMRGLGLPDEGQPNANPIDPRDNPAKRNPRFGLLLSKNGPTPDCSAAVARIVGTGRSFTIRELGFDYRMGSHCGAGAPRFNIVTTDQRLYFAGCLDGTKTPAPQDPTQWTRIRFSADQVFPADPASPPFEFGVTEVRRLVINYDEGTDIPTPEEPSGVGLVVLDNIDVNGQLITAAGKVRE